MMYLYAVDPGVVNNKERLQFLATNIGVGQGRWIADLPNRNWIKLVYNSFDDTGTAARRKREVRLERIKRSLVRIEPQEYSADATWISETTRLYGAADRDLIRAIIAESSDATVEKVVAWDDLDDDAALWQVSRHHPEFARTTAAVLGALNLLLPQSRTIHVVDPYLQLDGHRGSSLCEGLLKLANQGKRTSAVVFHTTPRSGAFSSNLTCLQNIASHVGANFNIDLFRWHNEPERGVDFPHDRAVLTELGGVQFGAGLDEVADRTMTASLIDSSDAERWISRFDQATTSYELIDYKSIVP